MATGNHEPRERAVKMDDLTELTNEMMSQAADIKSELDRIEAAIEQLNTDQEARVESTNHVLREILEVLEQIRDNKT
jgi:hypothetical protein